MTLKGIFGSFTGTVIGSSLINEVGKFDFPFKSSTQTFMGLGVLGNAAKGLKDWFK